MRLFKILNGICQYLAARNKTLWSGTWSSGGITVPDTDKYRTFIIKFGTQYMTAIRNLDDSITGTLFFASNNGQTVYQNLFTATVSGNRWTFKTQTQFGHHGNSSHSAFQQINSAYIIEEIVGLEPILSEFVNIGGGYCVAGRKGRWLYEIIRHISRPGRSCWPRILYPVWLDSSKISKWCSDLLQKHFIYNKHNKQSRIDLLLLFKWSESAVRAICRIAADVCELRCCGRAMGASPGNTRRNLQSKTILSGKLPNNYSLAMPDFCHRSLEIVLKGVAA